MNGNMQLLYLINLSILRVLKLLCTVNGNNFNNVVGNLGFTTGKYYFECKGVLAEEIIIYSMLLLRN